MRYIKDIYRKEKYKRRFLRILDTIKKRKGDNFLLWLYAYRHDTLWKMMMDIINYENFEINVYNAWLQSDTLDDFETWIKKNRK